MLRLASVVFGIIPIVLWAVLTKKHYLGLEEFTPEVFLNEFLAIKKFAERIVKIDKKTKHIVVRLQYLPPADSSIIHPHIQALLTATPPGNLKELLEASRRYYKRNSSNFWEDLVKFERENGERYVGNIKNVDWVISFTLSSEYEVLAVVKGKSSFLELGEDDFKSLADGLCRILKFFSVKRLNILGLT